MQDSGSREMADRRAKRGMRDEAGVGPNPNDARRLNPMRDLPDYKVADGEPDIRGWSVYAATGRELGVVADLLVDTDMGEVVMLDVDLRRDDRHTLAPIKAAWIDRDVRRVVLNTTMFDADEDRDVALRRHNEALLAEADALRERDPDVERRRYIRYGPSHERIIEDVEVRREVVDEPRVASTPAETERLRQEAGDLTHDARDTLVNPPPTEERR